MSPPPTNGQGSLRRNILTPLYASESQSSPAQPTPVVSLPPRMDHSFRGAASRQLPPPSRTRARIGGADTPPVAASGTNRVPVIERRRLSSRHAAYQKPFPVPSYLKHSTYAAQFFTTPAPDSPFVHLPSDGTLAPGAIAPADDRVASISEGLGGGDLRLGGPGAQGTILLPTCWDEDDRCALIELSSDGLGVSFGGACAARSGVFPTPADELPLARDPSGSAKYGDRDAASVRTNRPIPPQAAVYYFEVTIENRGVSGYIGASRAGPGG